MLESRKYVSTMNYKVKVVLEDFCVPCGHKIICGSMLVTHIKSSDKSDEIILKLLGYI